MNEYVLNKENLIPQIKFLEPDFDNFNTHELTSYIYENYFEDIDEDDYYPNTFFFRCMFSEEALRSLCHIYLDYIEEKEQSKYLSLKAEDGFDIIEVLTSLIKDLNRNYLKYSVVLRINRTRRYQNINPISILHKYLNSPYFKEFCDGLNFTYEERAFLLLHLADYYTTAIFPEKKTEEYKANLFFKIIQVESQAPIDAVRELNNKFIEIGLFQNLGRFVILFILFCAEILNYNLERCELDEQQDIYNYETIDQINGNETIIIKREIYEYLQKKKGCYITISSNSDFRNCNFMNFCCKQEMEPLFEFKQKVTKTSLQEIEFYLYALSVKIVNKNSVILLRKGITDCLISTNRQEDNTTNHYLFSKVRVPILLALESDSVNARSNLLEKGLDVLFSLDLKLPSEKEYFYKALNFFSKGNFPQCVIVQTAIQCEKLQLKPELWDSVYNTLNFARSLNLTQIETLIDNKFNTMPENEIQKNSHYCLEALNTTESVQEVIHALKNAENYQQEHYDDESGIRILLEGPSGTGKTAYVEQLAKELNKPLKIIRASDILGCYVGDTEKNIKAAFENAAKEKAILLIDEADSFLHSRGDSINRHNNTKVNEFLIQMERFPGILFCNTNLPDSLDKATDRRFHFKIGFNPVTKRGVSLLCESYFSQYKITQNQVSQIYNSGDVTPGDFGALNGRIRFLESSKINAKYITQELCKIVRDKERSWENKKVGFEL